MLHYRAVQTNVHVKEYDSREIKATNRLYETGVSLVQLEVFVIVGKI